MSGRPKRGARLDLRLYVIVDPAFTHGRAPDEVARQAIAGGATALQVRAKDASTRELLAIAERVCDVAQLNGVPVIVNDRADVALVAGADGVHVGQDDLPVAAARGLLGPRAIVGFSAGTAAAARAAEEEGADYLGSGDVFGTGSKQDADPPIGLAGLAAVVAATELPVVAIGGLEPGNAAAAVRAGAAGAAVISAVVAAPDVRSAARAMRRAVDGARTEGIDLHGSREGGAE